MCEYHSNCFLCNKHLYNLEGHAEDPGGGGGGGPVFENIIRTNVPVQGNIVYSQLCIC